MTITLPWPSALLSPNARLHWRAKSRATKAARADGFYAAKEAKVGVAAGDVPIILDITFHPPDKRKRDADNMAASIKANLDGIADALGVNDCDFRPRCHIGDPIKGGQVIITIGGGE